MENPVQEINALFPRTQWGYCPTQDNAADLFTRGITSTQLLSSRLWIRGPPWLTSMCDWPTWSPSSVLHISTSEETEPIPVATDNPTAVSGVHLVIDINRHSRLTKLLRITAYMLRFINNAKMPSQKTSGPLTATELHNTQRSWIKAAQQEVFRREFDKHKSKNKQLTSIDPSTVPLFEQ